MSDRKDINKLIKKIKDYRIAEYCCPDCEQSALSELKYDFPVESLIIALNDDDPYIKVKVIEALGEAEDPLAVESLISATKDIDYQIREAAAIALGDIKDHRAAEPLITLLNNANEYKCVIEAATWALGEIKNARALEALSIASKKEDAFIRDAATKVLKNLERKK